jgi:hypothetical protein
MKTKSNHALAAALVKAYAKNVLGIAKVSTKSDSYSGGSSITVTVIDQHPDTVDALKSYVSQFQYGKFDGMNDIYEYTNRNADLPQVKYAFVNNEKSAELKQAAFNYLRSTYSECDSLPSDYQAAQNLHVAAHCEYVSALVHRILCDKSADGFWAVREQYKAAA